MQAKKQIFRAPAGFTAWPNTLAYQSICWSNGVSTTNVSFLDVASIPTYTDCAACDAALNPTPVPSPTPAPPITPGTPEFCLSFTNNLTVFSSTIEWPDIFPFSRYNSFILCYKWYMGDIQCKHRGICY